MIVWDDLEPSEKIKVYDKGVSITNDLEEVYNARVSYRSGDMWAPMLATSEPLLTEAAHFIDCIETRRAPITSGRLGLQVVEMLEAATRSMKMRGHPIELSPQRRAS
jgi:predicted dehydrogenase